MSVSQDQSGVTPQHMRWRWICAIAFMLSMAGPLIGEGNPWGSTWSTVGFLLMILPAFALSTVIGTLVALRHPWGAYFSVLLMKRRFAHPRLVGLALLWMGLVISALVGALRFLLGDAFFNVLVTEDGWKWFLAGGAALLAVVVVAVAPLLALNAFDRQR